MKWPQDICITCSITQGSVAKVLLLLPWIPCSSDRGPVYLGYLVLRGGGQPGHCAHTFPCPLEADPKYSFGLTQMNLGIQCGHARLQSGSHTISYKP